MRYVSIVLLPLLIGCGSAGHLSDHPAEWGYEGEKGPERWGELDPSYRAARDGKKQSPIDIPTSKTSNADLAPIAFHYVPSPLNLVNNGHTVEHVAGPGSWMEVNGKRYQLKQFHYHTPSEHTVDGFSFPIEMHFVHEADDEQIAVIAVLGRTGREHPLIPQVQGLLPVADTTTEYEGTLNPRDLLPEDTGYYHYEGSFTTPPCTEGVQWFVLRTPMECSAEAVRDLRAVMGRNNRPVQPLHDRVIGVSPPSR